MESSPSSSSASLSSSSSGSDTTGGGGEVTWFGMSFPFRSPLSLVMDYCAREDSAEPVIIIPRTRPRFQAHAESTAASASDSDENACNGATEEVAIRIIGAGEQESGSSPSSSRGRGGELGAEEAVVGRSGMLSSRRRMAEERVPLVSLDDGIGGARDSSSSSSSSTYQRYDIQQVAKWIEQILPFSLLLLIVFIRQHLQGFFVTICISALMFKSNEIVKKQTALKGDRKVSVLLGISFAFMLHVISIYWWYRNDDLLYPLAMLPPKTPPPFWHTIFIILVNDTLVRQAVMAFKCLLLIYYKNGRGHNFRRQGQMLTLVEYTLLLYRALLPTPVWYRFFLNKDYGSLFSSLTTGLYLTFKLTSVVEKVQCFVSALKALSKKEVHYGVYATTEQVNAAGDMCAICQEKMQAPILLSCKHMFCEECVSEWLASRHSKAASSAFLRGDHFSAQHHSLKARAEWRTAEELNSDAVKKILSIRNDENDIWRLDLHGLHATEAIQALEEHLYRIECQGFSKSSATSDRVKENGLGHSTLGSFNFMDREKLDIQASLRLRLLALHVITGFMPTFFLPWITYKFYVYTCIGNSASVEVLFDCICIG